MRRIKSSIECCRVATPAKPATGRDVMPSKTTSRLEKSEDRITALRAQIDELSQSRSGPGGGMPWAKIDTIWRRISPKMDEIIDLKSTILADIKVQVRLYLLLRGGDDDEFINSITANILAMPE
jgi:hypothetical protein